MASSYDMAGGEDPPGMPQIGSEALHSCGMVAMAKYARVEGDALGINNK